jgi:hypothetical protein
MKCFSNIFKNAIFEDLGLVFFKTLELCFSPKESLTG